VSVRRAIVEMVPSTLSVSEFCEQHGVSRWLFYDLRKRYAVEGEAALVPRSRAPKRVANRTPPQVEDRIVELRKELADGGWDCGPATIRFHLAGEGIVTSESTVWRVLTRRGFVTPEPRKRPRPPVHRFAAERANECWQIDSTHWQLADGTPVEIINVIDDCTRVCVASVAVTTCTTPAALDALARGAAVWGWPERVLSDNGLAFRGPGGTGGIIPALHALGIRDTHSRPYHPQTCGKVERFHKTQKLHLDSLPPAATIADLQAQLDAHTDRYNHHRPHRSIGRKTPAAAWHATPRSGPSTTPIGTPTSTHRLTVDTNGQISIGNRLRISLGAAHTGKTSLLVITGSNAHVFIDGRLTRQLTIDPNKRNHPLPRA